MKFTSRNLILIFLCFSLSLCLEKMPIISSGDKKLTEDDNLCLEEIRNLFTPDFAEELLHVYINSGRAANHLGDVNGCAMGPEKLQYVVMESTLVDPGFVAVRLGMCTPRHCNTEDHFSDLTTFISGVISASMKGARVETSIVVPEEIDRSLSPGAWTMIMVIAAIVLLWFAGIFFTCTRIGDVESNADKLEDRKSKWALSMVSFNPIENLRKLFTVKEGGDQTLAVLNGVRVMSMAWVILGHSFSFIMFSAVINQQTMTNMFSNWTFGIVAGGVYAVDTFFWLSGFLTFALLTAKMFPKRGNIGVANFLLIYFHRYYRLIIPLAFCQFLMMSLMTHFGNGPIFWNGWQFANTACETWWWSNLAFINNFVPWKMADQCFGWAWYLANDMQFFIFSPFIIYLYCKNRKIAYILLSFLILTSMAVNGGLTLYFNVSPMLQASDFDAANWMYTKPWSRMGPYFTGAIFGLSYLEFSQKGKNPELENTTFNKLYGHLKESKLTSFVMGGVGLGLTAAYVFPLGAYYRDCGTGIDGAGNCWRPAPSFIYNLTSRPFFVFGVAFLIIPTFVGRFRVIKNVLSAEMFVVLTRLSYLAYLIHPLVMFWFIFDQRQAFYVNNLNQWFFAIGSIIVTYFFCIPMTCLCEVPFMNLEKNVLFPSKRKAQLSRAHSGNMKDQFLAEGDETDTSCKKVV